MPMHEASIKHLVEESKDAMGVQSEAMKSVCLVYDVEF